MNYSRIYEYSMKQFASYTLPTRMEFLIDKLQYSQLHQCLDLNYYLCKHLQLEFGALSCHNSAVPQGVILCFSN